MQRCAFMRRHTKRVGTDYSRGYTMGGQPLRPARVQVGRASTKALASGEE
jgi:molecular chaperone GrpE (heat shock protein)